MSMNKSKQEKETLEIFNTYSDEVNKLTDKYISDVRKELYINLTIFVICFLLIIIAFIIL